jgi:hypothetical protein
VVLGFLCGVLAGVHGRASRLEQEVNAIADELWTAIAETTPPS